MNTTKVRFTGTTLKTFGLLLSLSLVALLFFDKEKTVEPPKQQSLSIEGQIKIPTTTRPKKSSASAANSEALSFARAVRSALSAQEAIVYEGALPPLAPELRVAVASNAERLFGLSSTEQARFAELLDSLHPDAALRQVLGEHRYQALSEINQRTQLLALEASALDQATTIAEALELDDAQKQQVQSALFESQYELLMSIEQEVALQGGFAAIEFERLRALSPPKRR